MVNELPFTSVRMPPLATETKLEPVGVIVPLALDTPSVPPLLTVTVPVPVAEPVEPLPTSNLPVTVVPPV